MNNYFTPFLLTIVAGSFVLTSCNRQENNTTAEAGEETITQYAEKSVDDVLDDYVLRSDSSDFADCAEITDSGADIYPRTILIDFGDGCTGPGGRTRTGIITVELSDAWDAIGSMRTVNFEGYTVSPVWSDLAIGLDGTRTSERLANNAEGQPEFTRTIDMTIARGQFTIEHDFSGVRTWISGYDNPQADENIFGLTGSGTAVRNGEYTIIREILDTLIFDSSCDQVTQGVIAVTRPLTSVTIDFGSGACDDEAVVTTANGNTFTIDLHQFPG